LPALLAVGWPVLLLASYMLREERIVLHAIRPFRESMWIFYSGAFLGSSPEMRPVQMIVMGFLAVMLAIAALLRIQRRLWLMHSDAWLVLGGFLILLMSLLPDQIGTLGLVNERLAFMGALMLLAWIGCQELPVWIRRGAVAVCFVATLLHSWAGYELSRRWQPPLAELASLRELIPGGSVVLPVLACPQRGSFNPLLHVTGYWGPKDFVNLINYEAFSPHFPVRFRDAYSPAGSLVGRKGLHANVPEFSITEYESERLGRVGFVVIYSLTPECILSAAPQSAWDASGLFELVASSSPRGHALVYRRRQSHEGGRH